MANCDEFPEFYFPASDGSFPWNYPCWNDDWERELRDNGSKTVAEWNQVGRIVQNGAKGTHLPCARITVFQLSHTTEGAASRSACRSNVGIEKRFETFAEATRWAGENPGKIITRESGRNGFIVRAN